jgi:hypothetical protein
MPETPDLNNDVLLERIQLTPNADDTCVTSQQQQQPLRPIDQCLLLAFTLNIKNSNPSDGLTSEQMSPFVTKVLEHPVNWMVHSMGLLLRSRLENRKSKTVERAVLQVQVMSAPWVFGGLGLFM